MKIRFFALLAVATAVPMVAEGQQPASPPIPPVPQEVAVGQAAVAQRLAERPVAPPPVQQIPPGSASMDPSETRTMDAMLMDPGEEITLDARLDEDVWQRAVPATNFLQKEPNNGESATERTEVRIAYNRNTFYMGVTMFDSEPDNLTYSQLGRDNGLPADDKLRWTIDTFLDGRTGYFFEMNPIGSMADALQGPSGTSREWDGIWNARAQRSDIGWTLEIEIPFQTLNFDPNSDT